jgi:hypothetical protein
MLPQGIRITQTAVLSDLFHAKSRGLEQLPGTIDALL